MSTPILTATRVSHMLRKAKHVAVCFQSRRARGNAEAHVVLIGGYKCTQSKVGGRGAMRREPYGPVMVHVYVPGPRSTAEERQAHYAHCVKLMATYEQTLRAAGCHVLFHNDSFGMHLKVSV